MFRRMLTIAALAAAPVLGVTAMAVAHSAVPGATPAALCYWQGAPMHCPGYGAN